MVFVIPETWGQPTTDRSSTSSSKHLGLAFLMVLLAHIVQLGVYPSCSMTGHATCSATRHGAVRYAVHHHANPRDLRITESENPSSRISDKATEWESSYDVGYDV